MLSLQSFPRKGVSLSQVGSILNLKDLKDPKGKDAGLYCGSRLRSGEVFAYGGLPQNLKDLKAVASLGHAKEMEQCLKLTLLELGGEDGVNKLANTTATREEEWAANTPTCKQALFITITDY